MAEERGGNRGRKGRRRYFQPKRDGSGQPQPGQPNQQSGQQSNQSRGGGQRPPDNKNSGQKARRARKRARSRQRYDDRSSVSLEAEVAYVAPQAVYIYEYSVHPELRDTYEFRPEHFSSVGRTLDDYQLDLSKLFGGAVAADGTPVMTNLLPRPEFDWSGWEDEDRRREAEQALAAQALAATSPAETVPAETVHPETPHPELARPEPPRPESRHTEDRHPEPSSSSDHESPADESPEDESTADA